MLKSLAIIRAVRGQIPRDLQVTLEPDPRREYRSEVHITMTNRPYSAAAYYVPLLSGEHCGGASPPYDHRRIRDIPNGC